MKREDVIRFEFGCCVQKNLKNRSWETNSEAATIIPWKDGSLDQGGGSVGGEDQSEPSQWDLLADWVWRRKRRIRWTAGLGPWQREGCNCYFMSGGDWEE